MKRVNQPISACRYCRFYQIEGRRGGSCQQLGVPVQGSWQVCALAVSPFAQLNPPPLDPACNDTRSGMPALIATALPAALPAITLSEPQPLLA